MACLLAMARLDSERAAVSARDALESLGDGSPAHWAALRVLARAGDRETLHRALDEYFEAPHRWRSVLAEAAPNDVRLADFLPASPPPEGDAERRRRTRLAGNLGLAIEVPLDVALASTGSELDARDPARFDRDLREMDPASRFRLVRSLAARDDEALIRLALDGATLGRLSGYLARSRYPVVRSRLVEATVYRGRALAAWLLSPRASEEEKRRAALAMRDAWVEALGAPGVYARLASLLGPETLVERAPTKALGAVPLASARARLETLARDEHDPAAVRILMTRDDRVLSLPVLYALERDASPEVRVEAERALLALGAAGSSLIVKTGNRSLDPELIPLLLRSTAADEPVLRLVRELASEPAASPDGLAALYALSARRPDLFIRFLDAGPEPLTKRFHFVLSLAGDEERIPLLVDLAVTESPRASREAAFIGLTEVDLGLFDKRLHRLAGHPERGIRFRAACALAPSGEPWVLRLLLADLDEQAPDERRLARRALARTDPRALRALLTAMVRDETASAFAVNFLLDLDGREGADRERALERAMWERLQDGVEARRPLALEAASRLSDRHARAAVSAYLEGL